MVLPAPVGPTMATVSPACTSNDTSLTPWPEFGKAKPTSSKRTWPVTLPSSRSAFGLARFHERILEPVEILELGAGVEHLVDERADLVEAADQQRCEAGEGDDVADAQLAVRDEIGADQQHGHHRDGRGEAVQRAGQRPPVEHRVLRLDQVAREFAQRSRLLADAVVALQHGDVADAVADMREDAVVVALDRGLARSWSCASPAGRSRHRQRRAAAAPPTCADRAKSRPAPAAPARPPSSDAGA